MTRLELRGLIEEKRDELKEFQEMMQGLKRHISAILGSLPFRAEEFEQRSRELIGLHNRQVILHGEIKSLEEEYRSLPKEEK